MARSPIRPSLLGSFSPQPQPEPEPPPLGLQDLFRRLPPIQRFRLWQLLQPRPPAEPRQPIPQENLIPGPLKETPIGDFTPGLEKNLQDAQQGLREHSPSLLDWHWRP